MSCFTYYLDIKAKDIKILNLPMYVSLSIEKILEKSRENKEVAHYLPDGRDMRHVPRQFIINVAYTIMG